MVKRAFLLPAMLALFLAGCGFFTASLFPGYLAQTEKSFDLGSNIDGFLATLGSADYRWYPQVFVLTTAAGVDYGGVLIGVDGPQNKRLLMLDPAGSVQFYDGTDLGDLHLRDANDQFVVGQRCFNPGDDFGVVVPTYISGINASYRGFSGGTKNYLGYTDGALTFHCNDYPDTWSTGGSFSVLIDTFGSFELRGMYFDSGAIGREVALLFFDHQNNRALVIFTPISGTNSFADGFSLLSGLSLKDYFTWDLEFRDVEPNNLIYTRKGIVLTNNDRAELMDFSGNKTGKSLDLGHSSGDVRLAMDLDGEDFYVFSPEDQMLYRGKTGW